MKVHSFYVNVPSGCTVLVYRVRPTDTECAIYSPTDNPIRIGDSALFLDGMSDLHRTPAAAFFRGRNTTYLRQGVTDVPLSDEIWVHNDGPNQVTLNVFVRRD